MSAGAPPQTPLGSLQRSPGLAKFKEPTSKWGEGWMSEILKNTLITELIWLAGAATQTFAPAGKYPRAVTGS